MPNPSDYKTEKEFMAACVPMRMDEGDQQDQAVAACMGMWREKGKKKSMEIQDVSVKQLYDSGMDADAYCRQESWDIQAASSALNIVAGLVASEVGEPEDMDRLSKLMQGLTEFINAEIDEMSHAASGADNESGSGGTNNGGNDDVSGANGMGNMGPMVETMSMKISKREDVNPKEGVSQYGSVAFADEKNKKYPIDTEEHIRAAWNYINKAKNAGKYSAGEVATIKRKIIAAWKRKIDKDGPPSAGKEWTPYVEANDLLVSYGSPIKDLGGGRIGGYLVRFTSSKDPDLTGDFFDTKTELHVPADLDLLYSHGQDSTLKRRVLGKVTTKIDDAGLWAEAQLNLRDEYEKAIMNMAKAGKLGFSSGALSHLVEREPAGKAMHIKSWWIGEASLTPSPAEFRNSVMTLKSLLSSDQAALTDADARRFAYNTKEFDMTEEEIKAAADKAVADALAARDAQEKAEAEKQAALKAAEDAAYKRGVEDVIKNRQAPFVLSIGEGDTSDEKNLGGTAFKHWVATGQVNRELIAPGSPQDRWGWGNAKGLYDFSDPATKAAFNVVTGGSGGFLVPDILYGTIQAKRDLQSWVRLAPVQHFQTPADHLLIPVENTKHSAFTLTAESATYAENEGTVSQVDLILYKYTKEVRMTEEFIAYNQTNFDAWLTAALARAMAVTENTLFSTGAGGTAPQGIVTGGTDSGKTPAALNALTAAELTSLTGVLGAGYNVQGEVGFLMPNATRAYISGLAGNFFSFAPTPVSDGGPKNVYNANFFGYPVYISDDITAMSVALGKFLVFANFNYFGVVERPGMMIQRNPYLHMDIGQVSLFASIYRGSAVLQAEACYYMTNHS